jgi:hypothetical protein
MKMCCYALLTTMCLYVGLCLIMNWYLRACVTMCCFVRVSVNIYEGVLLSVMMCWYVWSAICKNVLLCSAVWRCVAMCWLRLCVCMCDYALYELIPETMRCYVLLCVTICSYLWRCVAMCCLQLCVCMWDYVLLWTDIWDHLLLCPDLCDCL